MVRSVIDGTGGSAIGSGSHTDTRDAILDAAERLFALKGFDGAGVREIAQAAPANLGLISYYFGSKDRLFVAAVERRYDQLYERVRASVAAAPQADSEALIRAFLAPILRCASLEGEGWRNYLALLARGMGAYREQGLHPALSNLANIADLLRDPLASALGQSGPEKLVVAAYLLESAIIYITQDQGLLDARSRGRFSVDRLDAILDDLVRFLAAGFEIYRADPVEPARAAP